MTPKFRSMASLTPAYVAAAGKFRVYPAARWIFQGGQACLAGTRHSEKDFQNPETFISQEFHNLKLDLSHNE